jgi:RNA polymerase sigma-70 factor (ECF subfamily)
VWKVVTVRSTERSDVQPGLERFYVAAYPRLVAFLRPLVGSATEAEDVAQEAFVRLLPRWSSVEQYQDPEAWLRSVAFKIAVSRWRRLRTASRHLVRHRPELTAPAPDEDALLVEAALRSLSLEHRQVLVLHHGLGLSVDEIARELGVPAGTVKSRLSRARSAAAMEVTGD